MKRATNSLLPLLVLIALAVSLMPTPAHAWWNNEWKLRKKITLDTTATGAPISDPIGTGVVLVRLADFQFDAGKDDGSDIRFIAADDKTPLTYHLEKFDNVMGEAFAWVKLPDLKPGTSTTFWLYYGNQGDSSAPGAADAKGTYDSNTTLVYHFAEAAGTAAADATGNGNNAQNPGRADGSALIGPGLQLDGKTLVTIPASSSLNWTAGESVTWSAWINEAILQPTAAVFTRRDGGNDFAVGVDNGVVFVDVNGTRSQGGAAITPKTWHHVAAVSDGAKTALYVDGVVYSSVGAPIPALTSTSLLGGDSAGGTYAGFSGEMDELEIANVARPPGFIKLAAIEQNGDSPNKALTVAQDEQPPAGWLSGSLGLFGVILKSVTVDGWVVIGILGIMSVVSWYVMITKFFYLNVAQKCNAAFLKEWSHVAVDLTALDHHDADKVKSLGGRTPPKTQRLFRNSNVYRIYHIGSQEIGHRLKNGRNLSSRSIQAIRAALDGGYVRENHSINNGMVFLTISIAGGPFMGLLGTCIGVMITFAAIAATGEVNISAIAPGLAAALVATVAGLLVAIPALLGYNYLVSRMKVVSSDMQVFIDEFVTKMAEFYSDVEIERVPLPLERN
jgi:biopolymer transport protein ExbB